MSAPSVHVCNQLMIEFKDHDARFGISILAERCVIYPPCTLCLLLCVSCTLCAVVIIIVIITVQNNCRG